MQAQSPKPIEEMALEQNCDPFVVDLDIPNVRRILGIQEGSKVTSYSILNIGIFEYSTDDDENVVLQAKVQERANAQSKIITEYLDQKKISHATFLKLRVLIKKAGQILHTPQLKDRYDKNPHDSIWLEKDKKSMLAALEDKERQEEVEKALATCSEPTKLTVRSIIDNPKTWTVLKYSAAFTLSLMGIVATKYFVEGKDTKPFEQKNKVATADLNPNVRKKELVDHHDYDPNTPLTSSVEPMGVKPPVKEVIKELTGEEDTLTPAKAKTQEVETEEVKEVTPKEVTISTNPEPYTGFERSDSDQVASADTFAWDAGPELITSFTEDKIASPVQNPDYKPIIDSKQEAPEDVPTMKRPQNVPDNAELHWFNGHWYAVLENPMTLPEAIRYKKTFDHGEAVIITTPEENDFVKSLLKPNETTVLGFNKNLKGIYENADEHKFGRETLQETSKFPQWVNDTEGTSRNPWIELSANGEWRKISGNGEVRILEYKWPSKSEFLDAVINSAERKIKQMEEELSKPRSSRISLEILD